MTVLEFLGRFQRVKKTGVDKWIASCPCGQNHKNNDSTQSLSITYDSETKKILLNCHKGCSAEAICREVHCEMADLFCDNPNPLSFINWYSNENNLSFKDKYDYCYGEYQDGLAKIRFVDQNGNKTFRWIAESRGENKSGFKLTHDGCPHRLYVAGSLEDQNIVLVEGEKDADSVNRVVKWTAVSAENGATTGQAGGKWRSEYTEQLTGKTVYIMSDNDDAGRNFAQIEAKALSGHAAAIYMVDLVAAWPECPEKGDITDLIESVGSMKAKPIIEELLSNAQPYISPEVVEKVGDQNVYQAVPVQPSASESKDNYKPLSIVSAFDLNSHEYKKPDYIVDGILYPGLTIFAGPPKYGKSFLSLDLACCVASGSAFLDKLTKQGDVLYLDLEGTEWRTNERLAQLGYSLCPDRLDHTYEADTIDHHLLRQLTEQIESKSNPKLLIIDTMARVKGKVRRGEDGYSSEYRFLFPLHDLALKKSIAIICVTHTRKGNAQLVDDPMEMILGSTAQYGTADNGWVLTGKRDEETKVLHCAGRDYESIDLELSFTGGKWVPQGTVEEMEDRRATAKYNTDPTVKTIIHLVETSGGIWRGTMQDLINEVAELTGEYPEPDGTRMAKLVRTYMTLLKKKNGIITLVPASARTINGKSKKIYVFKQTGFAG